MTRFRNWIAFVAIKLARWATTDGWVYDRLEDQEARQRFLWHYGVDG